MHLPKFRRKGMKLGQFLLLKHSRSGTLPLFYREKGHCQGGCPKEEFFWIGTDGMRGVLTKIYSIRLSLPTYEQTVDE